MTTRYADGLTAGSPSTTPPVGSGLMGSLGLIGAGEKPGITGGQMAVVGGWERPGDSHVSGRTTHARFDVITDCEGMGDRVTATVACERCERPAEFETRDGMLCLDHTREMLQTGVKHWMQTGNRLDDIPGGAQVA